MKACYNCKKQFSDNAVDIQHIRQYVPTDGYERRGSYQMVDVWLCLECQMNDIDGRIEGYNQQIEKLLKKRAKLARRNQVQLVRQRE